MVTIWLSENKKTKFVDDLTYGIIIFALFVTTFFKWYFIFPLLFVMLEAFLSDYYIHIDR